MKASDLTSRNAVLRAIAECDALGRIPFLEKHGYDSARWFYVEHEGRLYDSKAVAGVALGYQHGAEYVRNRRGFTGGEQSVVSALTRIGFEVVDARLTSVEGRVAPKLRIRRTYTWEDLGRLFGFSPRYFSVGGGMLAVTKLNVLVVITHPGGAKSFDYDDYWDGPDLVYTGKGLVGHQAFRAENRDAGENRRTNYVFEYAGPQRLTFVGIGRCIDWFLDTAPDRNGRLRRIFRFRLAFNQRDETTSLSTEARHRLPPAPPGMPARAALRRPRQFDPERPPSSYRQAFRRPGRTAEETNVLREKATVAHHHILVGLDKALKAAEWDDISEVPGSIDLQGTTTSGTRVLFEAKSLTKANESAQIRSGLAQLLEYRFLWGNPDDGLCLVTNGPIEGRRARLLRALGIEFIWIEKNQVYTSGTPISSAIQGLLRAPATDAGLRPDP